MQDVYKKIEEQNLGKKPEIILVFDDIVGDMINNTKLNPIVTELCFRGRKLNILITFITQLYFKVTKKVRLNTTHVFVIKVLIKQNFSKLH